MPPLPDETKWYEILTVKRAQDVNRTFQQCISFAAEWYKLLHDSFTSAKLVELDGLSHVHILVNAITVINSHL